MTHLGTGMSVVSSTSPMRTTVQSFSTNPSSSSTSTTMFGRKRRTSNREPGSSRWSSASVLVVSRWIAEKSKKSPGAANDAMTSITGLPSCSPTLGPYMRGPFASSQISSIFASGGAVDESRTLRPRASESASEIAGSSVDA
jgi:hypothetical protein